MNTLQICPPHLSDVATLPWEIRKSRFQHYYSYTSDYLRFFLRKNNNWCTAALAVYLLLFGACYCLHSPSTAFGARYRRSVCIDIDMLSLAAAACCYMG